MVWPYIRRVSVVALILILSLTPGAAKATAPVVTVDTGVSAYAWYNIPALHRLVTTGLIDTPAPTRSGLLVVNTQKARTVARIVVTPNLQVIEDDSPRGVFYLDRQPMTDVQSKLIETLNLRTGRIDRTVSFTTPGATILAIDPPTGHAIASVTSGYSQTLQLLSSPGVVLRTRATPLSGSAYVDAPHRRLIFVSTTGQGNATPTQPVTIVALDMASLATAWTRVLPYQPAYSTIDPVSGRMLVLAPGGRVTIIDTVYGGIVGVAHPRTPVSTLAPSGQTPLIAIDWRRRRAFLATAGTATRTIDVADWSTGVRRTLVSYKTSSGGGIIGGALPQTPFDANQTLMGVDQASGNVVVAVERFANGAITKVTLNAINPQSGRVVRAMTVSNPAGLMIQDWLTTGGGNSAQRIVADGYLYGLGTTVQSNDQTGSQVVPAIFAIPAG